MIPVLIFTCDKYHWALRVTLHLYEKYWNWPVTVWGFARPEYDLPECATFVSMGKGEDYPAGKWSNAVIGALQSYGRSYAAILLEDYWLSRQVNLRAIRELRSYMGYHGDVIRGDLTSDRLYAENMRDIEPWGELDIIGNEPPAQYTMSTQASIWRTDVLANDILKPNESAGLSELNGTTRMIDKHWRAVGTRQFPVRYFIGVQQGKLALDGGYQKPGPMWNDDDLREVKQILREEGKL